MRDAPPLAAWRDAGDTAYAPDPNLAKVPVIFLTATVLKEETKNKGGTIGGHPFIPKKTLIDAIDASLNPPVKAK